MVRHRLIAPAALALAIVTLAAACGDDGSGVRDNSCGASGQATASASGSASSPASGSGSGSGSCDESGAGSGSGIAGEVAGSKTDNPLIVSALADYTTYVHGQVDETIAATKTFTDAVRAGDVEAAKAAYAPSRQGWERIEPIAGLVEEIDGVGRRPGRRLRRRGRPRVHGLAPPRVPAVPAEHDRRGGPVRRQAGR